MRPKNYIVVCCVFNIINRFPTKKEVERRNLERLDTIDLPPYEYGAIDGPSEVGVGHSSIVTAALENMLAPDRLTLKVFVSMRVL